MSDVETHPVQNNPRPGQACRVSTAVTLRAYEVYCHIHGRQEALVTGGCRGGFSVGELVAFLYAYGFPQDEWKARVVEATEGMRL